MILQVKKLDPHAKLPTKNLSTDLGYDLYCLEDTLIVSDVTLIRTGIAVKFPQGWGAFIKDRSSIATKDKKLFTVAGVIDEDYRGEVHVAHTCVHPDRDPLVKAGERVAQLVVVPCLMEDSEWAEELSDTSRGDGKFGSTGK
jgi:dUTP pyrophosphatase